jgi:uncharacterized protein (TIGR01777 family)
MPTYEHIGEFAMPVDRVWQWYDSPGAFRRIMPEWEGITPLRAGALRDGEETRFKVSIGPIKQKWIARHHDVVDGEVFHDRMVKGPFGAWDHEHRFLPIDGTSSKIHDTVQWKLPLHMLTWWTAPFTVKGRMNQMFAYRTQRVQSDLSRIAMFDHMPRQKVLVSGSTGLIGMQLCAFLAAAGHEITRLVRPTTKLPPDASNDAVIVWDDVKGVILEGDLNGFDTVIHLAGAGIGDKRWNKQRKELIETSRTIPTKNLATLLAGLHQPPKAFLSGSAIGFYGNRGDEVLTESSEGGDNFLAGTVRRWEESAQPAADAGIRTAWMRTGIVVTPMGGALKKLLLPANLGAGGPVGGGKQYYSWVSLDDQIYAIHHLMMTPECEGRFNLTAPNPLTQKQFAKTMGKVMRRPAFAPLPGFVLKILLGEMAQSLVLDGQRVLPNRLVESGYTFQHENLEACLRQCLGKQKLTR